MSQEERWNTRDRSYSAWHRRLSTGRFVGIERAQLLAMIDLDASVYVEYEDDDMEPLALVETAIDIGQAYKCATVTRKLAMRADMPAYVALYKLSAEPNPADPRYRDIISFRVMRIWPPSSLGFYTVMPDRWARHLLKLRSEQAAKLDAELFGGATP